jgi:outer membrane receptor protein involved in Fe transport
MLSSSSGIYTLESKDLEKFFSLDKFGIQTDRSGFRKIELYYNETGAPANHTIGISEVKAAFGMLDYTIIPAIRFSGGLRVEKTDLLTDVFQYYKLGYSEEDPRRVSLVDGVTKPGKLNELNFLPSANLIIKLRKDESSPINLRLNYSQTLARPSLREYSEVLMFDFELGTFVIGKPDLKMVHIKNYDLRLESYFKSGDNVSLSVFHKNFKNHIELVAAGSFFTNPSEIRNGIYKKVRADTKRDQNVYPR